MQDICTRSEMDIIPAFEAVVGGSNPSGCTIDIVLYYGFLFVVIEAYFIRILLKTVDKSVSMCITDIFKNRLFGSILDKIRCKIRIFY